RPHFSDRIDQLVVAAHVWHRRIETGATEVWQVLRVRRAAHKQPLTSIFARYLLQHTLPELRTKLSILDLLSQLNQLLTPVGRIMNKLLVVQQSEDNVVEFVSFDEFIVVVKRNRKTTRHDDSGQTRIQHLAEIRRLAAERQGRPRALLSETRQTR